MKLITFQITILLIFTCQTNTQDCLKLNSSKNPRRLYPSCDIGENIKTEIHNYTGVVKKILDEILNGESKGSTYNLLKNFTYKFGSRLSGTENLENSIKYMLDQSSKQDFDNVHGEKCNIPHWVRGNEFVSLLQPRYQKLAMLGLGLSIGTPPEGIIGETVVFNSFDEMNNNKDKIAGKIVVFNQEFTIYEESNMYRVHGASKASQFGAKAVLVRSVTPYSLNTPHTGMLSYDSNTTKIPAASITSEDAKMLKKMYDDNETIIIHLKMDAQNLPDMESQNAIADLKGTEKPDSVVVVSGHIDSWDVGHGAMDDGGGMMISWNTLAVLKKLGLRSKRTIRSILWTAEEQGKFGSKNYYKQHKHEANKFNFVMESDLGTFEPIGFGFSGTDKAACIFEEILKLLQSINVTKITSRPQTEGPDISFWTDKENIPGATLSTKNEKYFWYHHTEADKIDVLDSKNLDLCTAAWTVVSYIIADLSFDMPR